MPDGASEGLEEMGAGDGASPHEEVEAASVWVSAGGGRAGSPAAKAVAAGEEEGAGELIPDRPRTILMSGTTSSSLEVPRRNNAFKSLVAYWFSPSFETQ